MKGKRSAIKEWTKAFIIALLIVGSIRSFFLEAFTIPTSSMERTLLVGDFILVSKVSYGARTPITPIRIPFTHQTFPSSNIKSYLDWIQLPYYRIPGLDTIKRNDVVVFNYPMETSHPVDQRTHYVKRCVGLPGDQFEIREGVVYNNNSALENEGDPQRNYIVRTKKFNLHKDSLMQMGITEGGRISGKGDYMFSLTDKQVKQVSSMKGVYEARPYYEQADVKLTHVFPRSNYYNWNLDHFGPVKIPRKGDSIKLNTKNIGLYERIISVYEGNKLFTIKDSIYINDKCVNSYKFKMNYYFMTGDNWHNSADSRFWGFVPEDHIVGKAKAIIFSVNNNHSGLDLFRWNRFFRTIK